MTMLEVDYHAEHTGNDATPAVRCGACSATGQLRWSRLAGAFVCRYERGCLDRAAKRRRAQRRSNGPTRRLTGGRG